MRCAHSKTLLVAAALAALLALGPRRLSAEETLYASLGGAAGIERITRNALALYVSDPRLRADFDNINLDHLRPRIVDLLCQIADGPCVYKGRSMAASHAGLAIDQARFNAVVENLQLAMDEAGVGFWTQNRLLARLASMRREIVTR